MSDGEFYTIALRALNRLNPKMLTTGAYVNSVGDGKTCAFCSLGAFYASLSPRTTRIEPNANDMRAAMYPGTHLPTAVMAECLLVDENESFKPDDNSFKASRQRYRHIHAWLTKQVNA